MDSDYYSETDKIKLVAKRVVDNKSVHISLVTKKEGPFYCPETYEEVIIRECREKRDHFAYKARQSPVGNKESDLHKNCKQELLSVLQKKYPEGKWEAERIFKADKNKDYQMVRPDLSGRINGKGIIIEVQVSTLSITRILHRTEEYRKRGAYILWIVPLEENLGEEIFRPRLFERFLHTLYYGKVYYWYQGDGSILTPVHYGQADRYIEEATWYEAGEEVTVGGYYKTYKRVKTPIYGQKIDLTKDFEAHKNRPFFNMKNDKLSVPQCNIFKDTKEKWWKNE